MRRLTLVRIYASPQPRVAFRSLCSLMLKPGQRKFDLKLSPNRIKDANAHAHTQRMGGTDSRLRMGRQACTAACARLILLGVSVVAWARSCAHDKQT